ncbi:ADP-ribosylglycohydrolase [Microbacterium sp. AK009]|uniref:ADP-ribosylglycohydrolase family protein n=1 Tax=Microbacterium sp. AK009 TaxID=2723068 RepID=UPI0015C70A76|nr:ADP-ribosylglycohydrolase family protein [Microbacterium sp. AK009]NYF16608.1 ADP-ribosylglycohydrolase [Microbacterium sp. AK009]
MSLTSVGEITLNASELSELPADYAERVYAGLLGKILGVYVGRPVEGWLYSRIQEQLGDIEYYVHDQVGVPLIVVDDDISGTLAFLSAFRDVDYEANLSAEAIGEAWLNYAIYNKTIFWWGGMGNSTEHTAYLRMRDGVVPPRSGSAALNGPVVAEQIGSQIFIDGWAMLFPGDPDRAAELARRAASVSHDGEAIYAAQVMAAMEARAFEKATIDHLLDAGLSVIPPDCVIARLIRDLRGWHAEEPDWRVARERLEEHYGYHAFGGNVHVVPNHGVIILALLYGAGDWSRSMMIVNTCGWDTDCNSGNLGALLGIWHGLAGFEGDRDWRTPVADRLFLPTADGARTTTDAVTESLVITNIARRIRGLQPVLPKGGANFSFLFAGSRQGFQVVDGVGSVSNNGSLLGDEPGLRISVGSSGHVRVASPTFVPPEMLNVAGYGLQGTPRLHPGQTLRARLRAEGADAQVRLTADVYNEDDLTGVVAGEERTLIAGEWAEVSWTVPSTGGYPIAGVGIDVKGEEGSGVFIDWLDWSGEPDIVLTRPQPPTWRAYPKPKGGSAWRRAWVDAMDLFEEGWGEGWPEPFRLIQNEGKGYVFHGPEDWRDIEVSAEFTPHMADSTGLLVRVQGLRRHYSAVISQSGELKLVKTTGPTEVVLARVDMPFELYRPVALAMRAEGSRLTVSVGGEVVLSAEDHEATLQSGGIGLMCERGRVAVGAVTVRPA